MLTDTKLRDLKPQDKLYKVNDRDGLYVAVTPAVAISFRYNYSINCRQETVILQTFPEPYAFAPEGAPIKFSKIGRLIGNAVPVRLGEVIAKSLVSHVQVYVD